MLSLWYTGGHGLCTSGKLHSVVSHLLTNVLGEPIGPTFKGEAVQFQGSTSKRTNLGTSRLLKRETKACSETPVTRQEVSTVPRRKPEISLYHCPLSQETWLSVTVTAWGVSFALHRRQNYLLSTVLSQLFLGSGIQKPFDLLQATYRKRYCVHSSIFYWHKIQNPRYRAQIQWGHRL